MLKHLMATSAMIALTAGTIGLAQAQNDTATDANASVEVQPSAENTSLAATADELEMIQARFVEFSGDQIRASDLMGKAVYGSDDESIGEISDVVLAEDGKSRAALIDVGGFLGMGEHPVALPFDELKIMTEADDSNELRISTSLSSEQLEQAPAYQRPMDQTGSLAPTRDNTGVVTADAVGDQAESVEQIAEADAEANANTDAAANIEADDQVADANTEQGAAAGRMGSTYGHATQELTADVLLGASVYGPEEENVGEISDIVFKNDGSIDAVVLDVGGFLGIGEKPVAVGFDTLQVRTEETGDLTFFVNSTADELENAPSYEMTALDG